MVGLDSSSVISAYTFRGPAVDGPTPAVQNWGVAVALTAHGAELLDTIRSPAAAAKVCPEACGSFTPPQNTCLAGMVCPTSIVQLTTWDNLTQSDIDHWNERADKLLESPAVGGKLLGEGGIGDQGTLAGLAVGVFPTYQEAAKLARNIETVNG